MAKVLPSAPEAEASLLGTMMVYPNAARLAMEEGLSGDDFFLEANRNIFIAASQLYQEGSPIDLATVSTRLSDQNVLEKSGGIAYLTQLVDASVTSYNTKNYINLIKDKALMRRMIETAARIAEDGMEGQTSVDEVRPVWMTIWMQQKSRFWKYRTTAGQVSSSLPRWL